MNTATGNTFAEMAARIREMREIVGYSVEQMAGFCEITPQEYEALEAGTADPAFSVIHKCALAFGVDVTALMEGYSAKLSGYTVTRKGRGPVTAKEEGIELRNMAAMFRNRLATPYYVTYTYDEKLQNAPIHTSTHGGQEFDLVLEGQLKVKIGEHVEILDEGDSVFYKSSTPHGMIAIGGRDCKFLAMIMAGSEHEQNLPVETLKAKKPAQKVVGENFVDVLEDEHGCLQHVKFKNIERFNFAFDCVDAIAKKDPDKLALLHVSDHFTERRFTFRDMMEMSNQVANYMLNLGIRRGDKVMLVLKRHFQFWPTILACHKIGAVVIPATNQLMVHDFVYRFKAADVKAIFCTADGITAEQAELAEQELEGQRSKVEEGQRSKVEEGQRSKVEEGQRSKVKGQTEDDNFHCLTSDLGPLTSEQTSDLGPLTSELTSDLGPLTSEQTSDLGPLTSEQTSDLGPLTSEQTSDLGPLTSEPTSDLGPLTSPPLIKVIVNGNREGWHSFDSEYVGCSRVFERAPDAPGGNDPMLMFFTSGTTSYPKMALHSYKYGLGHYVTAKYWHLVERDGLHFTISETGWAKALWGKLYGQWLCEGGLFAYDFTRFDAEKILPMFAKYKITTFCAPPTMYRMLIKQDISKYDFTSVRHATTAGEALNPEVFTQFEKATGLKIYEGFGQTETTLALGNLLGDALKPGSMGKPIPDYGIDLVDENGNPVPAGEHGEIVVRTPRDNPHPGIFLGYYKDEEKTADAWRGGMYHTCDLAWKDEDGYYHYVGRADDVIKSSGYRIGPAEIENVIMELPYVLECGVSAAPDPVRGQVVKASIVLVKGKLGDDQLKKEIQDYVKEHTAPYKYPRIVVFKAELPKTTSGKIQRNQL